ncbi:liver carboxylesterase 1-like [Macrotis lagotis]|uniref:liver carboxylesterase 1-like n=1 Tax=Macrotis lagotis TaxID=92651 RepID=UPI003D68B829
MNRECLPVKAEDFALSPADSLMNKMYRVLYGEKLLCPRRNGIGDVFGPGEFGQEESFLNWFAETLSYDPLRQLRQTFWLLAIGWQRPLFKQKGGVIRGGSGLGPPERNIETPRGQNLPSGTGMASIPSSYICLLSHSTGDEDTRGNWGYLDQVAVLHWIQKNIASFRGDPGLVTIFGESAGGGCVSVLIVSPLTKNLFHRAISQSGVVLMESLYSSNIKPRSEKIITLIVCKITTSASMVHCIWQKTEEEILNTTLEMELFSLDFFGDPTKKIAFITAILDGVFSPKKPKELLAKKQFNHMPYIVGINNNEFSWLLPTLMQYPPIEDRMDQEKAMLLVWKSYPLLLISENILPLITEEYLGITNDTVKKKSLFMETMGDFFTGISIVMVARFHMGAPTYMYEFLHRSSFWGNMKPESVKADHGDDIFPVLGAPFLKEGASEEEKQLSRTMMKYWANFARNGDPNGEGLLKWPAYDQNKQHLEFDINLAIGKKLKEKKLEFWSKIESQNIVSSAVLQCSFYTLNSISLFLILLSLIIS